MRVAAGILILFATIAQAQDLSPPTVKLSAMPAPAAPGTGNLPPDFYPRSPCIKPDPAGIGDKPRDARDGKAVDEYNRRIQTYNKVAQAFNGCVTDYAAKARNDIERIQAAIRDANAR
jgi:hypothetical protein